MNNKFIDVETSEKGSSLESVISQMIEPPGLIKTDWLIKHKWLAIPVESASHFDDSDARRLAEAMKCSGDTTCFGFATEPLKEFPNRFRIEASEQGLLSFSRECAHFNFILISERVTFAVLCTVFDYFVVCGPKAFVEKALGLTIEKARQRFAEFASNSDDPKRLAAVGARYAMA